MNVTMLSRELDLSTQECSRHLSRLSEARAQEHHESRKEYYRERRKAE